MQATIPTAAATTTLRRIAFRRCQPDILIDFLATLVMPSACQV
jgi:hypothetical protein